MKPIRNRTNTTPRRRRFVISCPPKLSGILKMPCPTLAEMVDWDGMASQAENITQYQLKTDFPGDWGITPDKTLPACFVGPGDIS